MTSTKRRKIRKTIFVSAADVHRPCPGCTSQLNRDLASVLLRPSHPCFSDIVGIAENTLVAEEGHSWDGGIPCILGPKQQAASQEVLNVLLVFLAELGHHDFETIAIFFFQDGFPCLELDEPSHDCELARAVGELAQLN
jgi:hypothetical protein